MPHLYVSQEFEIFDVTERFEFYLKDYDFVIDYHPGKANFVVDALSQKSLFALRAMNTQLMICDDGSILLNQYLFDKSVKFRKMTLNCKLNGFSIGTDDCLRFRNRICVPRNLELIQKILHEAHHSYFSVHPGMKRDISKFVLKCLICQQVIAKH
ncbi:integrase [Gossypium australe]|uniref:Integrase n=1 Tax=Gossypium australe TaxID=47621 RepID=A0A5B6VVB2_9ROSI|nr:integrase [Gossypium australe]